MDFDRERSPRRDARPVATPMGGALVLPASERVAAAPAPSQRGVSHVGTTATTGRTRPAVSAISRDASVFGA